VLLRVMAPILSFTAEEAWAVLNPAREEDALAAARGGSIFFETWQDVLPAQGGEAELIARWTRIREIRAILTPKLEEQRAAGSIGSSLQAEVEFAASGADLALLRSLGDDLRFVTITSRAAVSEGDGALATTVRPSAFAKCERCWHYRPDVGAEPRLAGLCARCVANLEGAGEARIHA